MFIKQRREESPRNLCISQAENHMKKLNRNQIKYLAIIAMLVDHIGWAFVPTASAAGQLMHFIGRFTGPTMAYFLYEGFLHTRDKRKYGTRLAVFALISWIPFCSFEYGRWCLEVPVGVLYTLFLGFLAMAYCEKHENSWSARDDLIILAILLVSGIGDWPFFDVLWPLMFYRFRNNPKAQWTYFWVINIVSMVVFLDPSNLLSGLYNLGGILPGLVLQHCYSGEPGEKSFGNKWFFYVFYPLHLLVLAVIKIYLV